jgi:predicted ATPase
LGFVLPDGSKIHRKDLSSGEKQLLILMLTVLCQDEQPSLLLLDEPELSLHLKWQYRLIEILRNLNPNCQLVIATHSPSIFNDGWRDKVFWMEDLVKKVELVVRITNTH